MTIMDERVGTAQRMIVLDLLSTALAEGFLDLAEYEQRLVVVSAAKTISDLMGQLGDLPPQFHWDPRRSGPVVAMPTPGSPQAAPAADSSGTMSTLALVLGAVSIPMSFCLGAGLVLGVAAMFLGRPGLRVPAHYAKAMIGLVMGCIGIVLSLGMIAIFIFVPSSSPS